MEPTTDLNRTELKVSSFARDYLEYRLIQSYQNFSIFVLINYFLNYLELFIFHYLRNFRVSEQGNRQSFDGRYFSGVSGFLRTIFPNRSMSISI